MIPKAAFPPPCITPLTPILPNAFLYPSFLLLLLTRKNPGNISKPRNSSRLPGLILSSQSCEISIPFLYRPDFSKSSLFLPSLVRTSSFCLLTQNRYGVPVPAPAPAQNRCRPPRFFLFPFPASAGSQADGKWPFFCVPGSRLLSVYSSPPPECRPFRPLFALKTPRLPRPHLAACQSSHPFLTAWKPFHSSPKSQLFLFSPAKLRKT